MIAGAYSAMCQASSNHNHRARKLRGRAIMSAAIGAAMSPSLQLMETGGANVAMAKKDGHFYMIMVRLWPLARVNASAWRA